MAAPRRLCAAHLPVPLQITQSMSLCQVRLLHNTVRTYRLLSDHQQPALPCSPLAVEHGQHRLAVLELHTKTHMYTKRYTGSCCSVGRRCTGEASHSKRSTCNKNIRSATSSVPVQISREGVAAALHLLSLLSAYRYQVQQSQVSAPINCHGSPGDAEHQPTTATQHCQLHHPRGV